MDSFLIHVAIADDHPAIIIGIEQKLSSGDNLTVVGSARNSTELIALLEKEPCDVLVSDYAMPGGEYGDGIALFSFIKRRYPMTKIVVFTMLDNPAVLQSLMTLGISCVVSKSDTISNLAPAIYAAHTGGTYYSPTIKHISESSEQNESGSVVSRNLTQRESEVVRLYGAGMSVNEIARQLHRSSKTISTQKSMAMKKLGITQDIDLLRYAIENGFFTSSQSQEHVGITEDRKPSDPQK